MLSSPLLFDTHLHLGENDNANEIFAASRDAGVGLFMLAGTNLANSVAQQKLADSEPGVFSSVGIHPHEASSFDGDIEPYRKLLYQNKVKAVGEIGLDYHYDFSPRTRQLEVFEAFFALAATEKVPAIIHCREAYADCMAIIHKNIEAGQKFEFHSFTGTPRQAEEVLSLGGYLAYNGMVTFKKAENIRESLAVVPLDRLMLETDSPYLAPVPYRGKTNMPAYIVEIAKKIAHLRGIPLADLVEITTANGKCFFNIKAD